MAVLWYLIRLHCLLVSHLLDSTLHKLSETLHQSWWQLNCHCSGVHISTALKLYSINLPRREKTCQKRVSNQSHQLQRLARKFTCSKFTYGIFQKAKNKGAEQTARMRRLVCTCVIRNTSKTGILTSRPI